MKTENTRRQSLKKPLKINLSKKDLKKTRGGIKFSGKISPLDSN